ncbi:TetR/AcrR family transcriptional regulator [Ancylobacter mangrovi]|uniref:TetR/AcrR family transcriptional regulator n=1 Tax=Ancylobacter mangrovi TaxID=2972472 RepID=UPI002162D800|nr:TetR/AcrR family transcriptional regulator [Ancylobacter mangrovi]MCS0501968.1 TetR/AcrR family transcriptional regulator [Ancylobacter mangrovi]
MTTATPNSAEDRQEDSSSTEPPDTVSAETRPRRRSPAKRNAAVTRQRILEVAMAEFADHGFSGGRIDRISAAADVNVSMIYHYFSNKDDLYLAALEASYKIIRDREKTLDVADANPRQALKALVELTFDFLSTDSYFVRLIMNENLMMGRMVQQSATIPHMTRPLLDSLRTILKSGQKANVFRKNIDAENLYVSILGLCFIHVSNRYTLSSMFQHDFSEPEWLAKRRLVVVDVVTSYVANVKAK